MYPKTTAFQKLDVVVPGSTTDTSRGSYGSHLKSLISLFHAQESTSSPPSTSNHNTVTRRKRIRQKINYLPPKQTCLELPNGF